MHVYIDKESGSQYAGPSTPQSGSAMNISTELISFVKNIWDYLNNINAVKCNGTVVNTGVKGENYIKKTTWAMIMNSIVNTNKSDLKLVGDASVKVCSYESRNGFIGSCVTSRSRNPSFVSKKRLSG